MVVEVTLIFVGITAAFAVDRWNEESERRERELLLLVEISAGLRLDTVDLASNLRSNERMAESRERVLAWFDGAAPFDSAMVGVFSDALWLTNFISNPAGYENLKSLGFDLVSDDDLRLAIGRYYENSYRYLEVTDELFRNSYWLGQVQPRALAHFEVAVGSIGFPRDHEALRRDRPFRAAIATYQRTSSFSDGASRAALDEATLLIDRISAHIETLR